MNKKRIVNNPIFVLLMAFCVPFLVMTICACVVNIEPFGTNGFLVSDINAQFASFFTYWKDTVISGTDNLSYSLSKTLGGDMVGFSGYYLNNPFFLLLLLFPSDRISVGIYWMMALMVSFMGLTFQLMLDKKYGYSWMHLPFSWGYALSGYSIAYLTLPMYTGSLILLPVVVMGLNLMMAWQENMTGIKPSGVGKKQIYGALVYIISLGLSIWCNYYIGYMICIFSGLYFLTELLGRILSDKSRGGQANNPVKDVVIFALASLVSVLAVSPALIPIVKSLSGQKTSDFSAVLDGGLSYRPGALLFNLLPGQFRCDYTNAAAPAIYVGVMTLVCILLFLINNKIKTSSKLIRMIFLGVLVLSTWINGLDSLWHGMNSPVGFSHRQAFVIVFVLLLTGARGFESFFGEKKDKSKYIMAAAVLIMLIQLAELSANAVISFKAYESAEMYSQTDYAEYYNKNKAIIEEIKQDESLYRIEKDYSRNHNDAMMLGYNGLSHNSSCEKEYVKIFMARMGFRNQGIWAAYRDGSTAFADSMLGVKYLISRFDSTNKPYLYDFSHEGSYVFENPYASPLAWVDNMEHVSGVNLKQENLFEIQNQLAGCEIYTPAKVSEKQTGAERIICPVAGVEFAENDTDSILGVKNSGSGTASVHPDEYVLYRKAEGTDKASVEYSVTVDSDCNLYCYFAAPREQGALLYINDALWDDYFSDYRWGIVNCGNYRSGDEVSIRLEITEEELSLYNAYFYEEHTDALAEWSEGVRANGINMEKITSSHYRVNNTAATGGNISSQGDESGKKGRPGRNILVFSLPYEENWEINVDGTDVEPVMVYECLMAVPVPEDWEKIDMEYR